LGQLNFGKIKLSWANLIEKKSNSKIVIIEFGQLHFEQFY